MYDLLLILIAIVVGDMVGRLSYNANKHRKHNQFIRQQLKAKQDQRVYAFLDSVDQPQPSQS